MTNYFEEWMRKILNTMHKRQKKNCFYFLKGSHLTNYQ